MNRYRLRATPHPALAFSYALAHQLTAASIAQALVQALEGVAVRQIAGSSLGGYDVELQLDRPSHGDAVAQISVAFQQLGFSVAEATVTEWVTTTVELSILGCLGGGAVGSATRDPGATVIAAVVGGFAGAIAGAYVHKVAAAYQAQRHPLLTEAWQLTPIAPSSLQAQPALPAWGQTA